MFVHHMRAPLGRRHPDHNKYAVVLGRHQGQACRWPPNGRPALTAPARADHSRCVGRGEETAAQVEQRN
jgi:hypothetical protein